jgi:hypothetical protein
MTLTLDLTQEVAEAIAEAAVRQGRSREELAFDALKSLFLPQEDIAALAADFADGSTLSEQGFLLAAEGTRHIWDTPEEDKAWAHL